MMVVDSFLDRLTGKDEDPSIREAVLDALPQMAEEGDGRVVKAVLARLTDEAWYVRVAALHALPKLVDKGDGGVITAVLARLTDDDWGVRMAALRVLPQLVEKGNANEGVIKAVWDRLTDCWLLRHRTLTPWSLVH